MKNRNTYFSSGMVLLTVYRVEYSLTSVPSVGQGGDDRSSLHRHSERSASVAGRLCRHDKLRAISDIGL